jgi:hypothetical protein
LGETAVKEHEPTVANADLWTHYFRKEWGRWLDPLNTQPEDSLHQVAEGTAARVASFLTLVAAGPIAWLYNNNAPEAAPITGEDAAVEPPLDFGDELESIEDAA